MKMLVLLLATACANNAFADARSYLCTIDHVDGPQDSSDNLLDYYSRAKKTPVAIDRITGRVIHPFIGNLYFPELEIISVGGSEWSFKASARSVTTDGNVHFKYYEVMEFAEGPTKPFLAVQGGFVFRGFCK